ncbi:MAG: TonB C-terminal domain-containing protein [Bryobacteraceae bacterium]|nr:TonB C-terminal domain-containing protein [Bryobacteraceae bacterium]
MATRVYIWEYREDWSRSLASSLAIHCAVIVALAGAAWWNRSRPSFGSPDAAGGGAVGVEVVRSIPIPRRPTPENKVAENTENEAPRKVEKEIKPKVEEDEGISLDKIRRKIPKKKPSELAALKRYLPEENLKDRLLTTTGRAASSPMFSVPNAGSLGTGANDPFGDRFGWYAKLLRDAIARKWRTDDVPANISTLPPATVAFTIQRDGKVSDVRIVQASGNYALDNSAKRAVLEAAPFQALPPQFERSSASVEMLFELKR